MKHLIILSVVLFSFISLTHAKERKAKIIEYVGLVCISATHLIRHMEQTGGAHEIQKKLRTKSSNCPLLFHFYDLVVSEERIVPGVYGLYIIGKLKFPDTNKTLGVGIIRYLPGTHTKKA